MLMKSRQLAKAWALGIIPMILVCCSSSKVADKSATDGSPTVPIVNKERKDLVFSWVADGGPRVATEVDEVPEEARKEVRVQDPSIPPEKSDAKWMFFVDLTSPGNDGRYPVRAELRESYEARRRPAPNDSPALAGPGAGSGHVIMYSTRYCPVCQQARRWLLEQKIPFVEKDLERDPGASDELERKTREQGVQSSGVPVFDIGGKLLLGFDPGAIENLLVGSFERQKVI